MEDSNQSPRPSLGFAILAKHFEESRLPEILPKFLPEGWKGGFVLLAMITVLSSFLDNMQRP